MANSKGTETRTSIDDLNDSLLDIEQKVQNNQKKFMWGFAAVMVVVCLILVWVYAIRKPGIEAADTAIGQADLTLTTGNDSLALAQYMQVADNYGYDAGNRAALNAAIILYRNGKYEEALKYLSDYDAKENVIGAAAKSLEGDCYVNLENYDAAIKCFRQAAKISDNNPHFTPLFLMKEANVQRELKNYKEEANLYRTIDDKYPTFAAENAIEIEKYLKRAELQVGE